MPYITLPMSPRVQQLTFDMILAGEVRICNVPVEWNETNTRTRFANRLDDKFLQQFNFYEMKEKLQGFNRKHETLFQADRQSLYDSFFIPKKSGGRRRIDAPCPELMTALRELKDIFERELSPSRNRPCHYHTTASAYIRGRSVVDALKRHQRNKSFWFLKLDFSDFFGSTTEAFVLSQMRQIFPFDMLMEIPSARQELERAVSLCFLHGRLPQGTPISPMLTNLVMLPIDYELNRKLRRFGEENRNRFVYTRYADDILISARRDFRVSSVKDPLRETLRQFNAPYRCKEEKTRYGSRAGRNWNLGLMLNKDNQITVGWQKKKRLRAVIDDYMLRHETWDLHDVQVLAGQINYFTMVEPEYMEGIMAYYAGKYGESPMTRIRRDLKEGTI